MEQPAGSRLSPYTYRRLFWFGYTLLGFVLIWALCSGDVYAQNRLNLAQSAASFTGEARYDNSGSSVAFAGDVNGDGYDDFLIGAHNNDSNGENAGKCYLIFGKSRGWQMDQGLSKADISFLGEADNDNAGISVSFAGDVNGDGYDDFLIGAHTNDDSGEDAGKCYLFFGRQKWKKSYRLEEADVVLTGDREREKVGLALSAAGDVNGDGYDDFLIGAYGATGAGGSAGECYLVLGRKNWKSRLRLYYADASFLGEDTGDRLGVALSAAGDVNGDGYDDFLIGAPYNDLAGMDNGQVYLILGRKRGWQKNTPITKASASFVGENAGDNAGISVSFAGDVNGDGYSDILIGADSNSETGAKAGKCYLLLGKAGGWKLKTPLSLADAAILGEKARDHLGVAVASLRDVNGDGLDDFIIGASRSSEAKKRKAGKSYLFWGRAAGFKGNLTAASADLILAGESKNDLSGNSLSYAGDVNGDGYADILIGADANSETGRSAGQTYLLFPTRNTPPRKVYQIKLKTDNRYIHDLKTEIKVGRKLYIQLKGQAGNPDTIDLAQVLVSTSETNIIKLGLIESRKNSGIYQGSVQLANTGSNRFVNRFRIEPGDIINIRAKADEKIHTLVAQAVSLIGYEVDDDQNGPSSGNNNGRVEAGETVELSLRLINRYFERVTVSVKLKSKDPYVTLINSYSRFGTIPSRYTQAGPGKFVLAVSKDCPHQHRLVLEVVISDKRGPRWTDSFQLLISRLTTISGRVKNRLTGQGIVGAKLRYAGHTVISKANGAYAIYLSKSSLKENLSVWAPYYLKTVKQITHENDRQLDIFLSPRLSLTQAPVSFIGEEARDASGYAVAYAGDVNGDGLADFLIGAWGNDEGGTDAGQTYLILGRAQGWQPEIDLSNADASFIGENMYDESGKTLAYAGDVNGDGFSDFLIGAASNDRGGDKAGQVYLILGRAQGWRQGFKLEDASASFVGEVAHDRAGSAIAYAGDVNGDGYDDFLVGAWSNNVPQEDAGQTYLIFGKPQGWQMYAPLAYVDVSFVGENARDESGKAVSYAGDVNGDGYDDFIIGAPSYNTDKSFAGKCYLVFGRPSGWGWQVSLATVASFIGEGSNNAFGFQLSYAGDVNGDGYGDFVVGAWSNDEGGADAGQVYLFLGKPTGWEKGSRLEKASASFIGEGNGDAAGLAVTYAGDVNGDGYDDFIIGAPGSQLDRNNQGQSYLILGKSRGWSMDTSLSLADLAFVGRGTGDAAGRSLAYAGDVNGDGYDDFIIGAWGNDRRGANAGESYLFWLAENTPPQKINSLKLIPPSYTKQGINWLQVRLAGEDSDPRRRNVAQVLVESTFHHADSVLLKLTETAPDSGEYDGKIRIVSTSSNPWARRILAHGDNMVTVSAKADGSITESIKVKDVVAPFISKFYPQADEQRAPINTGISIKITDPGMGVDKSSLSLQINRRPVQFRLSGDKYTYELYYRPPRVFDFGETVRLDITAADMAQPPNVFKTSYSFKTAKAGIILNPGFEEDFAQWEYKSISGEQAGIDQIIGARTSIDPTTARSGIRSCKVEFTGERDLQYEQLYQGPIPVEPNTKYLLMGYVKTENLSSKQGIRLHVEGSYNPYRTVDPQKFFYEESSPLLGTNDWTLLSVPFSTKMDTNYVFVYLYRPGNGGLISGTCWLDDVSLMTESEPGFGLKRFKAKLIEYFR